MLQQKRKPDEQLATIATRDEQTVQHSQAVHHVAPLCVGTLYWADTHFLSCQNHNDHHLYSPFLDPASPPPLLLPPELHQTFVPTEQQVREGGRASGKE